MPNLAILHGARVKFLYPIRASPKISFKLFFTVVSSNIHIKYWPRIERLYVFRL